MAGEEIVVSRATWRHHTHRATDRTPGAGTPGRDLSAGHGHAREAGRIALALGRRPTCGEWMSAIRPVAGEAQATACWWPATGVAHKQRHERMQQANEAHAGLNPWIDPRCVGRGGGTVAEQLRPVDTRTRLPRQPPGARVRASFDAARPRCSALSTMFFAPSACAQCAAAVVGAVRLDAVPMILQPQWRRSAPACGWRTRSCRTCGDAGGHDLERHVVVVAAHFAFWPWDAP
jgi:hypothetical protein